MAEPLLFRDDCWGPCKTSFGSLSRAKTAFWERFPTLCAWRLFCVGSRVHYLVLNPHKLLLPDRFALGYPTQTQSGCFHWRLVTYTLKAFLQTVICTMLPYWIFEIWTQRSWNRQWWVEVHDVESGLGGENRADSYLREERAMWTRKEVERGSGLVICSPTSIKLEWILFSVFEVSKTSISL